MAASRMGPLARLARFTLPAGANCVQIPVTQAKVPVVTTALIEKAHSYDLAVHVWTIDDEATMIQLLDHGVDRIITDRPTVLKRVLEDRGCWTGGKSHPHPTGQKSLGAKLGRLAPRLSGTSGTGATFRASQLMDR